METAKNSKEETNTLAMSAAQQLLKTNGGSIQITKTTAEALEILDYSVIVICIVGARGTGKSTLCNHLAEYFGLTMNTISATKGMTVRQANCLGDQTKAFLLLDTEGFDNLKDDSLQAEVLLPLCTLLSHVLIYNTMYSTPAAIYKELKYANERMTSFGQCSPTGNAVFLLVIRDCPADVIEKMKSGDKYMEVILKEADKDFTTNKRKFNLTACSPRKLFNIRKCFMFPSPMEKTIETSYDQSFNSPNFAKEVEKFSSYIHTGCIIRKEKYLAGIEFLSSLKHHLKELESKLQHSSAKIAKFSKKLSSQEQILMQDKHLDFKQGCSSELLHQDVMEFETPQNSTVSSSKRKSIEKRSILKSSIENTDVVICYDALLRSPRRKSFRFEDPALLHWHNNPTDKLKMKLKQLYKNLTTKSQLHTIPNLNESDVVPSYFENEIKPKIMDFTHEKYLLQGRAGSGKSSIANKLAYDWATDQSYMTTVDLIFFIPVPTLQDNDLESAIEILVKSLFPDIESGWSTKLFEKNVLVILDGLNHLKANNPLRAEIEKGNFKNANLLITSQPGPNMALLKSEFQKFNIKYNMDYIPSFSNEKQRTNFFFNNGTVQQDQNLVDKFESLNISIGNSSASQFLLNCNALLNRTVGYIGKELTLTELIVSMLNYVLNHINYNKAEIDVIQGSNQESRIFQEKLAAFGEECFKKLKENLSTFTIDDPSNHFFYENGLLSKHKEIQIGKKFSIESWYQCEYSFMMDFSSAYFLWRKSSARDFENKVKEIESIMKGPLGTSLIAPFLCELLHVDPSSLFQKLQATGFDFGEFELSFWRIVATLYNHKPANSIAQFVPKSVHFATCQPLKEFYSSKFHENIIRHAIRNGRLSEICVKYENGLQFLLPTDCKITKLSILVVMQDSYVNHEYLQSLVLLNIVELHYRCTVSDDSRKLLLSNPDFKESKEYSLIGDEILKVIQIFNQFTCKTKTLICEDQILQTSLDKKDFCTLFSDLAVHTLECVMSTAIAEVVTILLRNNNLYKLKVTCLDETLFDRLVKIINLASQSESLLHLQVRVRAGKILNLDFHQLASKEWSYLHLIDCNLSCNDNDGFACIFCTEAIDKIQQSGYYLLQSKMNEADCEKKFSNPTVNLKLLT